jgi:hypothetical protein
MDAMKCDERCLKPQSTCVLVFRDPVGRYREVRFSTLIRPGINSEGDLPHRGLEKMRTRRGYQMS